MPNEKDGSIKNENILSEKEQENPEIVEEKEISQKEVWATLFSGKFILIYIVTVLRTGVSFYYSNQMKLLGMNLINDDRFISRMTIFGFIVNLTVRLNVGKLYNYMGFNGLYCVQIVSNFTCSVILFYFGHFKLGYLMFMLIQRISSGRFY